MLKWLDSGNAVLIDIASDTIKWQSFLDPPDTFLPGMKTDSDLTLTSSKRLDDPSPRGFEFR
ncbi:Bulb-type lectin domain-containing protein, partial [Cynara cardunculus var. scolymus]